MKIDDALSLLQCSYQCDSLSGLLTKLSVCLPTVAGVVHVLVVLGPALHTPPKALQRLFTSGSRPQAKRAL